MSDVLGSFWFWLFLWIAVPSVVATITQAWQKVKKTQAEAGLKQAMVQRGLSVEEIERVLRPAEAPASEEKMYHSFGECLAHLSLSGSKLSDSALAEVMAAFSGADLATKRALLRTLKGFTDGGGTLKEEGVLALVRGLRPPAVPHGTTQPAAPRSEEFMTRLT
jgi:hypothetical protein